MCLSGLWFDVDLFCCFVVDICDEFGWWICVDFCVEYFGVLWGCCCVLVFVLEYWLDVLVVGFVVVFCESVLYVILVWWCC